MSNIVKKQDSALATVPDYIGTSSAGLENVGREQISFPRVNIAQETSPAAKKASSEYISGIEPGDLFNTLTRDIYKRPLTVVPILFFNSYIKFRPQDQGGGVLRMADNTDNIKPEELVFGLNGEKPVWSTLWNFLVFIPETTEVALISMKSTSVKIAKQWLSLQSLFGKRPAFARYYQLQTEYVEKGATSYFNFSKVKSTGFVSEEDYKTCEQLYSQFAGKTIQVSDEAADSENVPF